MCFFLFKDWKVGKIVFLSTVILNLVHLLTLTPIQQSSVNTLKITFIDSTNRVQILDKDCLPFPLYSPWNYLHWIICMKRCSFWLWGCGCLKYYPVLFVSVCRTHTHTHTHTHIHYKFYKIKVQRRWVWNYSGWEYMRGWLYIKISKR